MKKNAEVKRLKLSSEEWNYAIYSRDLDVKVRVYSSDYSIGEYVECYGDRKESLAKIVDINTLEMPFEDDLIVLTLRLV